MPDPPPAAQPAQRLQRIDVARETDPTRGSFLKLRHLVLVNQYDDGTRSEPYVCDIMERPGTDAVGVVAYRRVEGRIEVLVREGIRPPAYFRKDKELPLPDPGIYRTVPEVVAGGLEAGDEGEAGLKRRAAIELWEEAGLKVDPDEVFLLGGGYFPSPGTYTEKVYLAAVEVDAGARLEATTDDPMEQAATLRFYRLAEALTLCQTGAIPDPKAEMGFRRLADHLGYLPELDLYYTDLPDALSARFGRLGM